MQGGNCPCSGQAGGKRTLRTLRKKGGSLQSLGRRSVRSLRTLRTLRKPKILTGFMKSIAKAVSCKKRTRRNH